MTVACARLSSRGPGSTGTGRTSCRVPGRVLGVGVGRGSRSPTWRHVCPRRRPWGDVCRRWFSWSEALGPRLPLGLGVRRRGTSPPCFQWAVRKRGSPCLPTGPHRLAPGACGARRVLCPGPGREN